ncbi:MULTISPECIES: MFS transporter [unclassified Streptomyces]|uniref:MFS transporter n=1 Tax=unclassified Streptomyces TaxID=2593676 RepID=UPI0022B644C8|nr:MULTISPECIES: MFS transporter [unclassified Streptomyces]MCZ7416862.1 MFS transporter [Streptomyces sp. WMMC897]MCZ7433321.1 MFS transporter [Streptomyces sp. WMMC1477]
MVHIPTGQRTVTERRRTPPLWAVVFAVCAGQFLIVLDISVVNVALPSIRDELGMSASGLQWVVNAYTITFAGFLLLGGRAGDLFGRKRVFLLGLALFTLASLAGGLAQEAWHLLLARAVQGVGAAVLAPATLTLLTVSVPEGPARNRAIGTWTAVGAGGGAAGGLVGGVLTEGLSWRWVLLVNVPIGAVVLAAAAWWLVETRAGGRRRLDAPGAVLVTAGLGTLAYGIVATESAGWTEPAALVPLLAGLVLLAAFLAVEARTAEPLMPLRLFRLPSVAAANAAMFVSGATMICSWYFITLYLQNVLDYSPIQAGLSCVPHSLTIVAAAKLAPRLMAWAGARNVAVAGFVLACGGYLWQSTLHADGSYLGTVLGPGIMMMLGAGLAATPLASAATSGAPAADAGIASGLVNMSRTMGGSLGLAVLATLAAARVTGDAPADLAPGYALAFRVGAVVLALNALFVLAALPRKPGPAMDAR